MFLCLKIVNIILLHVFALSSNFTSQLQVKISDQKFIWSFKFKVQIEVLSYNFRLFRLLVQALKKLLAFGALSSRLRMKLKIQAVN